MKKPKALIFSGYGLNCEEETKLAFEIAGGEADIVHINDIIKNKKILSRYQILAFPGGFSYGDDTGSGKAYAAKIKNHIYDELQSFIEKDKLVIAICNGFQIVTNVGLLPGALMHNDNGRYTVRWVDLQVKGKSPWLTGINRLSVPIAHGEGKYFISEKELKKLKNENAIACVYEKGEICDFQNLEANPNGSLEDIAGVTAKDGRILGMMPHPERAIFKNQMPMWFTEKELAKRAGKEIEMDGPGISLFKNGIGYFSN